MNIVVLGAGGMGAYAARTAGNFSFVNKVMVCDINHNAAKDLANQLGGKGIYQSLDVLNPIQLENTFVDADFILNTTGPFFKLGLPVLHAAIKAGVHYVDICDDWEPTLEMLELSNEAAENDVLAIIGMGSSPGVTNLLAVLAADSLDTVDTLLTGWSIDDDDEVGGEPEVEPSAALIHWMQQISGTIRIQQDGEFGDHKPLAHAQITYPELGKFNTWTMGHPEAVTLPLKYPNLTYCANVMTGAANAFTGLAKLAAIIDAKEATLAEAGKMILETGLPAGGEPGPNLGVVAWAEGRKNGTSTIVAATTLGYPPSGMGGATGVPLAVVLQLHNQGILTARGVHAPETAIKPGAYFDALAPLCPRVDGIGPNSFSS
ncbi:MAG: saccharopine dehydrogenase, partial [Gammaproteobacteria bacterium]|nr:saccharopine dehydrogenase [Gammaproteobacteria bacterium]